GAGGRAAARVPQRRPARLAVALGGRLRDDRRAPARPRAPGPGAPQGGGARLGPPAPGRRRRGPGAAPARPRARRRAGRARAPPADPSAQVTIGVDRPWAEWMGSSHFQLGPLHLCDYLLRAELGISGIAIEIAPGYTAPGSHMRDLFEFSKLLDLYSLLNVPL